MNLEEKILGFTGAHNFISVSSGGAKGKRFLDKHPFAITDGVKFLIDETECHWVVTEIVKNYKHFSELELIGVSIITKDDVSITAIADPECNLLSKTTIPETAFPLEKLHLYVQRVAGIWIIMLESEY